jgi:oxygen-independent coproporphyrinogen-3 oxidase
MSAVHDQPTDDPGFGVYLHWPYCAAICPYCAFNVVRERGRGGERSALHEALLADLDGWRARTGPRALASLYLGGGTPSRLDSDEVAAIVAKARALWDADDALEVTLEANPDDCDEAKLAGLADAGVTRLSIGVQALDDAALKALGRWHTADDARAAVTRALRTFARVSLDLIYARPGHTIPEWRTELAQALALGAEHVSLYELTIEPGTAFARRASRGLLAAADDAAGAAFLDANMEVCAAAGFEAYETSNYARAPSARSAHNLVYWRSGAWAGVGPGAHGRLGPLGGARVATETEDAIAAYIARVRETGWGVATEEPLDAEAQREEALLMGLRLAEGVDLRRLQSLGGLDEQRLAALEAQGLLARRDGRLVATPEGRPLVDRLVLELLG